MKYILSAILLYSLAFSKNVSGQGQLSVHPVYAGVVTFASAGLDGYDAPQKGDSVFVYSPQKDKISFRVVAHGFKRNRSIDISFNQLILLKKNEYKDMVAFNKEVATGSYDMKFSYPVDSKSSIFYTVNLTHFGNGGKATLTVIDEDRESARFNNILIADLVKVQ